MDFLTWKRRYLEACRIAYIRRRGCRPLGAEGIFRTPSGTPHPGAQFPLGTKCDAFDPDPPYA